MNEFLRSIQLTAACVLLTAAAASARPPQEDRDELEELGTTLKAAVMSGTLSEEEAIRIYYTMAERLAPGKPDNAKSRAKNDAAEKGKSRDGADDIKSRMLRRVAPDPGDVTALFQPDFLPRDLQLLDARLSLDPDQTAIADIVVRDYLESLHLATTPLREAIDRHGRSASDQWVAAALDRAHIDDVDAAVARTENRMRRWERAVEERAQNQDLSREQAARLEQERAKRAEWTARMVEVTVNMEDRLAVLRVQVQESLDEMNRDGGAITGDDVVRTARQLQSERLRLYVELTESLALVVNTGHSDAERAAFGAAMQRVRIERGINQGRLGGESMNMWAVVDRLLARPGVEREPLQAAVEALDANAPAIAAALDARSGATINRELRGLEFLAIRERAAGDEADRIDGAYRKFAEASRREAAASVTVRDALYALLEASSAEMAESQPDANVAGAYRRASLRRGFPTEMRERWSERAIDAALGLENLDIAALAALVALEGHVNAELGPLREDAIRQRLRRDHARLVERIDDRGAEDAQRWPKFDPEEYLGVNHETIAAIDQRMEDQLRSILTPEQFDRLPSLAKQKTEKTKSDGKAKTGGKPKSSGKKDIRGK